MDKPSHPGFGTTNPRACNGRGGLPSRAHRPHARPWGTDQLHGYVDRPIGDHSSNYPGKGDAPSNLIQSVEKSGAGQSSYEVHDEDVTAAAIDFINREGIKKRSGQTDTPFCLHMGYMLPHSPYIARKADYDQYIDVITPPKHPKPTGDESHPFFQWWRKRNRFLEIEDTDTTRARRSLLGTGHSDGPHDRTTFGGIRKEWIYTEDNDRIFIRPRRTGGRKKHCG